jgi:Zn-dependent protease with chaperone function
VTIDDRPLDICRKFFLGHELGHFAYAKEYRFYSNDNRTSGWFIRNWSQSGQFYSLLLADLFAVGLHFAGDNSWLTAGLFSSIALSILFRLWGYSMSGTCHEEELYCDMFSLCTAKSDEERRAMVREARRCFGGDSKIALVWDTIMSIIVTSTHPSAWWRIRRLEEEATDTD